MTTGKRRKRRRTKHNERINMESFQVRWPGESPTQDEFMKMLPTPQKPQGLGEYFHHNEWSSTWNTLESDMREVSTQHPNTIFTVEIGNEDGGTGFNTTRRDDTTRSPKSGRSQTSTPRNSGNPTPRPAGHQHPHRPGTHSPGRSPGSSPEDRTARLGQGDRPALLEAALERVPRLRGILAAAHRECNQFGETTECIKDIFSEHLTQGPKPLDLHRTQRAGSPGTEAPRSHRIGRLTTTNRGGGGGAR